jgi:hypothetical protein
MRFSSVLWEGFTSIRILLLSRGDGRNSARVLEADA